MGVFRLRNVNIVGFYYLFNCATCFGHTTVFNDPYFPRTYSIDYGSVVFRIILIYNKIVETYDINVE
jgi:hypothetical protein